MIKASSSGEILDLNLGMRNVVIEHNEYQISLVGYTHHEQVAINKVWTHMDQMKVYRDGKDVSDMHPAGMGGEIQIDSFEDILRTIRLIDDGCFKGGE